MFPYDPRSGQADMMDMWESACRGGSHLAAECGTGSGKTVSALAPAMAAAMSCDRKVLYLTRTNSQQRQAFVEVRAMLAAGRFPTDERGGPGEGPVLIPGLGVQGRSQMCPMAKKDPKLSGGDPEELSHVCADMKRAALTLLKGGSTRKKPCPYYMGLCTADTPSLERWVAEEVTGPEEVAQCDGVPRYA